MTKQESTPTLPAISAASPVSRRILLTLASFAFLCYMLRMNISVAQQYMMRDLHLTDIQIGQVFSAFMVGYALFQVPAGLLGDRFGARRVLAAAALLWALMTLLSGWAPGQWTTNGTAALVSLIIFRFLLGAGEAAMYPVAAQAVSSWMPPGQQAFANATVMTGSALGASFTPPLIASVMQHSGWRATFFLTAVFPVAAVTIWLWQSRHLPPTSSTKSGTHRTTAWWQLLRNRNVLILSLSYLLDSYLLFIFVFWLFRYLVDVRKLGITGSGFATSLPFLVAAVMLPVCGFLSDRLSVRYGPVHGRRIVAIGCLLGSGTLLFVGASASASWVAVAAIALSVGFIFGTEGPYWSCATTLAGEHAGGAGGFMNMAGNLGGILSTLTMPWLIASLGWYRALSSGALLALAGAVCWMLIDDGTTRSKPA